MEKRNIIEEGRTPGLAKQGSLDDAFEKQAVATFRAPLRPGHPNPKPIKLPCGGVAADGSKLY